ncbi:MAG: hypothetical protein M3357_11975 [Actinomycetota bacterium]|nr:hypothetical protein [Actinomycetota bacterium]
MGWPEQDGFGRTAEVFEGPVPRAQCGPGSRPETALQGEVTIADRESGRSSQGYTCNLEQVGNYAGEGAQWQFAGYGDCGYYGTRIHGSQEKRGTIVVDASDRTQPRFSTNLTSPAMLDSWESLKVHHGRGLLGGVLGSGPAPYGGYFDVYDVAGDCAHPRLLASLPVNGLGHEGEWAPDGRTYYAAGLSGPGAVSAIDVSDPEAPRLITTFLASRLIHGMGVSQDGNRLYLAHVNEDWVAAAATGQSVTTSNGLGIYDVSEIETRTTSPQVTLVSELGWNDGAIGQHALPITHHGKPYVVFVDEFNHGGTRIIDIADERNPRIVSKLKLEIQMPENQELAHRETAYNNENGGVLPFGYNSHYCNADRLEDPTILACSNFESGIRVFDIRDVAAPREIAYFNPGGDGTRRPASWAGTTSGYTSAQPRIIAERGEIWFTDHDRGFYIVRFTNGAWPFPGPTVERRAPAMLEAGP